MPKGNKIPTYIMYYIMYTFFLLLKIQNGSTTPFISIFYVQKPYTFFLLIELFNVLIFYQSNLANTHG